MRLQPGNPMGKAMMITLVLEMIAFGLAVAVMIQVTGVPVWLTGVTVGGASLLCLLGAGLFRTPAGYPLGWLAQLAGLALGLLSPVMFVVAGVFAVVWVLAFVLGRKIDNTAVAQERTG